MAVAAVQDAGANGQGVVGGGSYGHESPLSVAYGDAARQRSWLVDLIAIEDDKLHARFREHLPNRSLIERDLAYADIIGYSTVLFDDERVFPIEQVARRDG